MERTANFHIKTGKQRTGFTFQFTLGQRKILRKPGKKSLPKINSNKSLKIASDLKSTLLKFRQKFTAQKKEKQKTNKKKTHPLH